VSEPPVQLDADGVAAAPRKSGFKSLDMVIAGAAILLSLISLGVAIQNSRTQQKLVTASSWPLVMSYTNNLGEGAAKADHVISIGLANNGVGPAKVESVRMSWRGREMTSNRAFLRACCWINGGPSSHDMQANIVSPNVLRAGDAAPFLVLPRSGDADPMWTALDRARLEVKLSVCYCSVFNECWMTDGRALDPPRVKSCPKDSPPFAQ
jgi:hypothetical protein